jgi:hypothetical protein
MTEFENLEHSLEPRARANGCTRRPAKGALMEQAAETVTLEGNEK